MINRGVNKKKIINDPVHGFINLRYDIIYDIIEHSYFQRLRRIKQLGLTYFVYPGATHTRFQHALGAMHLTSMAVDIIRNKGHEITEEEAKAVTMATLLHDIGHGPFSHALEKTIIEDLHHEQLSLMFMEKLNNYLSGHLDLAIKIFKNNYKKRFLHQLVSGQLDMDRMDYLKRDSFFTGVHEGVIGSDRLIKMLNVHEDELVIDYKGIYSVEKFLIARRLMYWQVYLHKTVIAAEKLMENVLLRARELIQGGQKLFATPALSHFLESCKTEENTIKAEDKTINLFAELDDNDIMTAAKVWKNENDTVLSLLCERLLNRKLFRVEIHDSPVNTNRLNEIKKITEKKYHLKNDESHYFVFSDIVSNNMYEIGEEKIHLMLNTKEIRDISSVSDIINLQAISTKDEKYFICYPKECEV